MYEIAQFLSRPAGAYPTCIQKINYPAGKFHGQYFFVGSVPGACYDHSLNNGRGGSIIYETEELAINAAINAGVKRLYKSDCSLVIVD